MLLRFLVLTVFSLAVPAWLGAAGGQEPWRLLSPQPRGQLSVGGVAFGLGYYGPGWQPYVAQSDLVLSAGFPQAGAQQWSTQGALPGFSAAQPGLLFSQQISSAGEDAFDLLYTVSLQDENAPLATENGIFLQLDLPVAHSAGKSLLLNGQERPLPVLAGEVWLFSAAHGNHTLVLPTADGEITLSGAFALQVQDQRKYGKQEFALRLRFAPAQPLVTQATLGFRLQYRKHVSVPVSLHAVANRGFSDQTEGDNQGGWTDQGPGNDMAILPAGLITAAGIEFEVVDETANDGRGALVLGTPGGDRGGDDLLQQVWVDVPGEPLWRNLYLLHAAAWPPARGEVVGRVRISNTDGTQTVREIVSGRDVGNWWAPVALENAVPGWVGQNPSSAVGLYVTRLPLPGKAVQAVSLEIVAASSLWLVAGISGSEGDIIPLTFDEPWVAQAGPDWAAFDHSLDIEAGSVFDFSFMADAPAGKYGAVVASPSGHFEFAGRPGQPARFWGVNINESACFLESAQADELADRLVRSGYNSVRFHHFERELLSKQAGAASHALDPAQLDKLDYLFAALKARGIYINIDLYVSRPLKSEELDALGFNSRTSTSSPELWFKALIAVSDDALELWKPFARELLTHRNPYTGLTWMEDPALIGICPVNEDSPPDSYSPGDSVIRAGYETAFDNWLTLGAPEGAISAELDALEPGNWFVYEHHIGADAGREAFLRQIGVNTLLTGANFKSAQGLAFLREHYDYVDNHSYWDHPDFPGTRWKLPFSFSRGSAVRLTAQVPRVVAASRILDKPFAVTEFNFVRPNRYRAEGGVLMPAYASLQDWGALYNFEYAWGRPLIASGGTAGVFSLAADPVGLLADRVSALVFLRGDIAPAQGAIGFAVEPQTAFATRERPFPESFSQLALVTKIGSRALSPEELRWQNDVLAVVVDADSASADRADGVYRGDRNLQRSLLEDGVLPAGSIDVEKQIFRSDTGQIELNAGAGTVQVVSPRSELFVLPGQSALGQGGQGRVSVRNGDTFGTVSVVSVDGQDLAHSERILVLHLTEALPTGMRFASASRQLLEATGGLPHLVERGQAELTLSLDPTRQYRAWAVGPTGARLREVPLLETADGLWQLQMETAGAQGTALAYEIAALPLP